MTYRWLKWTRVFVALVFFSFQMTLVFVDFRAIVGEGGVDKILFLQFVPSLLRFLTVFSIAAGGFIIILILTVIFGRVYCSAVCPLGILQDMISRVGRLFRKKRKRKYKYQKPRTILRYVILSD